MPIPKDKDLYEKVKKIADEKYKKPSAYKSGFIVKTYKECGGEYIDDNKEKNLKRWFKEEWKDIGDSDYPVYRPTKRINKNTPLTDKEIDPKQLKEQIKLKQIIKGKYNLPKFKEKIVGSGILEYSNPDKAYKMAKKYFGENVIMDYSTKKDKKYMILNPDNCKWVHFGQMGFEDYTEHNDKERRKDFLNRNYKWANADKYTPAFMAYHILW